VNVSPQAGVAGVVVIVVGVCAKSGSASSERATGQANLIEMAGLQNWCERGDSNPHGS
jgi:hypothetical protein